MAHILYRPKWPILTAYLLALYPCAHSLGSFDSPTVSHNLQKKIHEYTGDPHIIALREKKDKVDR